MSPEGIERGVILKFEPWSLVLGTRVPFRVCHDKDQEAFVPKLVREA